MLVKQGIERVRTSVYKRPLGARTPPRALATVGMLWYALAHIFQRLEARAVQ